MDRTEAKRIIEAILFTSEKPIAVDQIKEVKGIAFRESQGLVHITAERPFNFDLDSLPYPARDLLPMDIYF